MFDLKIANGNVYSDRQFKRKHVYVEQGKIAALTEDEHDARETYDARGAMVLPGFIDPHVHFSLHVGGRTSADDFYTGSVAAAYGGVTTFVDFLDPTDTKEDLEKAFHKRKKEAEKSVIDYKLHATLKSPKDDLSEYVKAMRRLGMDTLKVFTTYSDSDRRTYDGDIERLLELTKEEKFLLLCHIEKDSLITLDDSFTHEDLAKSRPSESETLEALKLAGMVKKTGGMLYMVHLSSGNTLRELKTLYPHILNRGFYIETCPQYLAFTRERLHDADGHLYTFAPPLRTKAEQALIKKHIGDVHTIGTDHAPFLSSEKKPSRLKDIPLGVGSVEHAFNVLYHMFGDIIIDKMTLNPAKRMGLYPEKGTLEVGSDADITIVKKTENRPIDTDHSACDYSLYKGMEVSTRIVSTLSRGRFIIKNGALEAHKGAWIKGRGIND